MARINVSYETREANDDEGKSRLLPRLSKLNLQGVHINSCEPNGLLIVDKDVKFTISNPFGSHELM